MANDADIRNLTKSVQELTRTMKKLGEIIEKFNKSISGTAQTSEVDSVPEYLKHSDKS